MNSLKPHWAMPILLLGSGLSNVQIAGAIFYPVILVVLSYFTIGSHNLKPHVAKA
jgi:hypothetical protein